MKIRSGFVSNSSSSSFVVLGFKVKQDEYTDVRILEALNIPFEHDEDNDNASEVVQQFYGVDELDGLGVLDDDGNNRYIGFIIADDESLESKEYILTEMLDKLMKIIKPLGLDQSDQLIKVHTGTRMC